ncbi:MAG: TonB-dependent receptor domain-containing protein, partial [Candidatus Binatia bacterium]
ASLRYDRTTIDVDNRIDPAAGGEHRFERVNPAVGVNVRAGRRLDLYGGYGESFRAPSAIELTCANEDDPCPLPVAFADDPPLDEVKARSFEVGLRGRPTRGLRASLALFHTELEDDILFVASSRAEGFFRNVDETRRVGIEAGLEGRTDVVDGFVSYGFTHATFESTAVFPSPPGENVARPGDRLPGVPNHLLKAGLGAPLGWGFRVGADLQYVGDRFLRGDEANDFAPLDDYVVVNARLSWTWKRLTLFARAENLLDAEYETFGAFAENPLADERVERFLSPGAPLAGWFGIRIEI